MSWVPFRRHIDRRPIALLIKMGSNIMRRRHTCCGHSYCHSLSEGASHSIATQLVFSRLVNTEGGTLSVSSSIFTAIRVVIRETGQASIWSTISNAVSFEARSTGHTAHALEAFSHGRSSLVTTDIR